MSEEKQLQENAEPLHDQKKNQRLGLDAIKADTTLAKKEINGPKGLEPTRYGDWESKGRCVDF